MCRILRLLLGCGIEARDARTGQDMATLPGLNQSVVKRLRSSREIRERGQLHARVESIDGENISVNERRDARWRARPVVFGADEEVVDHLLTELAAGNSGVIRKSRGIGRDVIHAPMREC